MHAEQGECTAASCECRNRGERSLHSQAHLLASVQQGDQCKRVSVDGASNGGDAQRLTWCQPSAVAAAARATVNAQPVTPLASTHNLDRTVKDDVADEWRQTLMVIVRRTAIIFVVIVVTRNVAKNKHSITLKLHTRTNTKHHQPIDQNNC